MPHRVQLYKYDLSNGMARQMSLGMLGIQIEAIWHTSVVVYEHEFYFDGGVGVTNGVPGGTRFGRPIEIEDLGMTEVEPTDFAQWVWDIAAKFGPTDYRLLERNCNHFSDEALNFLVGRGVSDDVSSMIARVLSTPLGQMMRPSLEAMTTAPEGSRAAAVEPGPQYAVAGPSNSASEVRISRAVEAIADIDDPYRAAKALALLRRVIGNILEHPSESKYASINVEGTAFAAVANLEPAYELLRAVGFVCTAGNARWTLPPDRTTTGTFEFAAALLSSAHDNASELVAALEASA